MRLHARDRHRIIFPSSSQGLLPLYPMRRLGNSNLRASLVMRKTVDGRAAALVTAHYHKRPPAVSITCQDFGRVPLLSLGKEVRMRWRTTAQRIT